MVGGKVIGLSRGKESTLVTVQGSGSEKNDVLSVRCREVNVNTNAHVSIGLGDSFWWQCGKCYWTPKGKHGKRCGVDFDRPLTKLGYSH